MSSEEFGSFESERRIQRDPSIDLERGVEQFRSLEIAEQPSGFVNRFFNLIRNGWKGSTEPEVQTISYADYQTRLTEHMDSYEGTPQAAAVVAARQALFRLDLLDQGIKIAPKPQLPLTIISEEEYDALLAKHMASYSGPPPAMDVEAARKALFSLQLRDQGKGLDPRVSKQRHLDEIAELMLSPNANLPPSAIRMLMGSATDIDDRQPRRSTRGRKRS